MSIPVALWLVANEEGEGKDSEGEADDGNCSVCSEPKHRGPYCKVHKRPFDCIFKQAWKNPGSPEHASFLKVFGFHDARRIT